MPWGEIVGAHSFETMGKLFTRYGDSGPSQARLSTRGNEGLQDRYPDLDYVTSCAVVDDETTPADLEPYDTDFVHATFKDSRTNKGPTDDADDPNIPAR